MALKKCSANEVEINVDAAYVSLMSAIQSFFDTYRTLTYAKKTVDFGDIGKSNINEVPEYQCNYFISITHFQHFFEIVLKNILKSNSEKYESFPQAFKKLKKIQKKKMHDDIRIINALLGHRESLCVLNKLRNFAWHQGIIKQNYSSYDFFVGYEILPLALNFFDNSKYPYKRQLWLYKKLSSDMDPINEIYEEFKKHGQNADYEKIALLKEMGWAAFRNPLIMADDESHVERTRCLHRRAVQISNSEVMNECCAKIKAIEKRFPYSKFFRCPICGQKTLVSFVSAGNEDVVDENGNVSHELVKILDKYECQVCSFKINSNIKSLSIDSIDEKEVWKWKDEVLFTLEE